MYDVPVIQSYSITSLSSQNSATQHAQTMLEVVPINAEGQQSLREQIEAYSATSDEESSYKFKWDGSNTVKLYSTIYYTEYGDLYYNGGNYIELNSIVGGYYTSGVLNGTTIVSNQLLIKQAGGNSQYGYYLDGQVSRYNCPVDEDNFRWWRPSSWVPVEEESSLVGCVQGITLKRPSGYTWYVELDHSLTSISLSF